MRSDSPAHNQGVTGMSFSVRSAPAVLITLLSLASIVYAQSTTTNTSKTPRGSVSGRITIKEHGVPGVPVGLRKNVTPYERFMKTVTDYDGFYRITNVPPGTYQIMPSVPAYVIVDNNNAKIKNVIVGEDENVEGINFSLVRGGVITGKVTDADGRPIIQQPVALFRAESFLQSRQQAVYPTANVQTDDRGIYRVYGLTAGRYKVAAGLGDQTAGRAATPMRAIYKQVFHPDVADQAKAAIVEVIEGSEARDIDISLGRPLQTYSVLGRVVDAENGSPVPNYRVGIQRLTSQRPESITITIVSNAQGGFLFEGVAPGKYRTFVPNTQTVGLRPDELTFDIVDRDITGLTVRLKKGATLTGVVVLESGDKAAFQRLVQLQLQTFVNVAAGPGFGHSAFSPISPDGSFHLAGLPTGTAIFALSSRTSTNVKGFTISRIERNGVVAQRNIEVKEGEEVAGIRVVVAYGSGTIRGIVKLENGSLPPGTQMFVRVNKPGESFSGFPTPQVDARGHFLMEGLPAGTYELWVLISGTPVSPARRVKHDLSVQNGAVTDVLIPVDLSTPPN